MLKTAVSLRRSTNIPKLRLLNRSLTSNSGGPGRGFRFAFAGAEFQVSFVDELILSIWTKYGRVTVQGPEGGLFSTLTSLLSKKPQEVKPSMYDLIYDFAVLPSQKPKESSRDPQTSVWTLQVSKDVCSGRSEPPIEYWNQMGIVGVLGGFSTGKTWLINQLSNSKFAESEAPTTRGISVKLPPPNALGASTKSQSLVHMLLDSAGTNAPVMMSSGEEVDHVLVVERILRDTVLTVSNAVIYSTQNFSARDQRMIENLKKSRRTLFVSHNLRGTTLGDNYGAVVFQIFRVAKLYPDTNFHLGGNPIVYEDRLVLTKEEGKIEVTNEADAGLW